METKVKSNPAPENETHDHHSPISSQKPFKTHIPIVQNIPSTHPHRLSCRTHKYK